MSSLENFQSRLERLYSEFARGDASEFGKLDCLVIATGTVDADDDAGYLKCFALMTWLFDVELQGAALVLLKDSVTVVLSSADAEVFRFVDGKGPASCPGVKVLDADKDSAGFAEILQKAVSAEAVVGTLTKEIKSQHGTVASSVCSTIEKAKSSVNVAGTLAKILAVKDAEEVSKIRKASILSAAVFRYALVERIEKTIDNDKKVPHNTLSSIAEDAIINPAKVKVKGLKPSLCDPCYPPIVQSASKSSKDREFDLRPSAESDDKHLHFGCIIASVGARYSNYCSNISRTLLVDPSKEQEEAYSAVLKAHEAAIDALVPGATLRDSYNATVDALKASGAKMADDLVQGLGKNVGFGTGIEYRDSTHLLNGKNDLEVRAGMTFNVAVGCQNLVDPRNGKYAVLLADTVHVRDGGLKPDIFTASARKDLRYISYELGDEEEEADEKPESYANGNQKDHKDHSERENGVGIDGDPQTISLRARRRSKAGGGLDGDNDEGDAEKERRRKHQVELEQRMLDRGRARLEGGLVQSTDGEQSESRKKLDEYAAYSRPSEFPPTKSRQLTVDMESESLLVPINGVPVPFHVSTIKNASKSDEGRHTYLRINFHVPQNASAHRAFSRVSQNAPTFPNMDEREGMTAAFVKELSFRSSNPQNLSDCMRQIKELVKRTTTKQTEAREKETLVGQEKVRLVKGGRVPFVSDATIRPPIASGKNNKGVLEAHLNGFYFRGRGGHAEITYSNIRNAIFQEADQEIIVCIHLHLKNDIMVGKRKTKDVQFYTEVMESAVRLNDKRRRHFDQDELEEEQREREMRNRTNKLFLKFTKEVEDRYGVEFDIPYRSLAFTGAPRSSTVTLLPTVNCIIDVIDWPPFILNLEDVEIAHFERVNLQLRNFDLVFVFKNFQDDPNNASKPIKDMWIRISAIDIDDLNGIKKYLNEQDIKYYEGPMSLQWNNVLKNVRMDLEGFYGDGGWRFLSVDDDDDGGEGGESGEDSLEGDEEFQVPDEMSDDDFNESSDASSEYSDSEASGDMVAELEGDSEAGEDELSSDEEGLDWDEQERKAKADDAKRPDLSDDEDTRGSRKKSAKSGSGAKSKPQNESRKRRR